MSNVLYDWQKWPIRLIHNQTAVQIFQQIKFTLQNVVAAVWELLLICVAKFVFNHILTLQMKTPNENSLIATGSAEIERPLDTYR